MSLLALKGSSGDHSSHSLMEYGQFPFPSTSVSQDNLFQERSHSQSKDHSIGNIKIFNDVNFFVHFQMTPKFACLGKLTSGP